MILRARQRSRARSLTESDSSFIDSLSQFDKSETIFYPDGETERGYISWCNKKVTFSISTEFDAVTRNGEEEGKYEWQLKKKGNDLSEMPIIQSCNSEPITHLLSRARSNDTTSLLCSARVNVCR